MLFLGGRLLRRAALGCGLLGRGLLRRRLLRVGTFPPAFRASDRPIAIACLRLVTFLPEPPLFSVPRLRSCIAFSTLSRPSCRTLPPLLPMSWNEARNVWHIVCLPLLESFVARRPGKSSHHAHQLRCLPGRVRSSATFRSTNQRLYALPGCFVWVALKRRRARRAATMQEEFGLHELADRGRPPGHQRPKIEEYDDTLFAVLHTVEIGPTDDLVSARSTSSSARTSCSPAATAPSRDSSACARAPSASRTCSSTARVRASTR